MQASCLVRVSMMWLSMVWCRCGFDDVIVDVAIDCGVDSCGVGRSPEP
jgi:hypothetical protein